MIAEIHGPKNRVPTDSGFNIESISDRSDVKNRDTDAIVLSGIECIMQQTNTSIRMIDESGAEYELYGFTIAGAGEGNIIYQDSTEEGLKR
jgi:hypothetical protein